MEGLRVIVCGGRDFADWDWVFDELSAIHAQTPIQYVFHGNARGVDSIAGVWANRRKSEGVKNFPCPAQWAKYGKAAGPKRNQAMLGHKPDLVIAFPGGRGTADMVRRARAAGIRIHEAHPRALEQNNG